MVTKSGACVWQIASDLAWSWTCGPTNLERARYHYATQQNISCTISNLFVQCSRSHFCDSSSNHRQTQLNDLGYKTIARVSIVVDVTIDMHARSSSALPPLVACRSPRRGTATRRHSSPADAYSCNYTSLNSFTAKHTLEEHFNLRAIKATWSNWFSSWFEFYRWASSCGRRVIIVTRVKIFRNYLKHKLLKRSLIVKD